MVLVLALVLPAYVRGQEAPPAPRTLLICLDGVGYDLAVEMHRRGELRHFLPPVPLINSFPSDTNPALTEALAPLGAPPARGYEDHYFDTARNRLRGGVFHRLTRKHFIKGTYRELFHYHPNPARMTVEYAAPVLGPWLNGVISLARLRDEFKKSRQPVFFAYFEASDSAAHLNGAWLVRQQVRAFDRWVGELLADREHPVRVILFSDHGNDPRPMRPADLGGALRRAGFRRGGKIKDERSVVLPQYGLVSTAVVYTAPGREPAVAEALRAARGVDFSAYRRDAALYVVGPKGTARIEARETEGGLRLRYRAESGDALLLEGIADELTHAGEADADGFISEQAWLRATADHIYPDPLRRLWASFHGLMAQPASVVVSLEDGYYTGSWLLDAFAPLQATHGNLRRAQSRGVVLSTDLGLFLPYRGPFTGANLLPRILGVPSGAVAAPALVALPAAVMAPPLLTP
jgi:hypothetical protein